MNFVDQLIITVIDKAVIGLVVLVAGYWLNRQLESYKSGEALRKEMATLRAAAYIKLWALTETVKITESVPFTKAGKEELKAKLTKWYYEEGNALYLSFQAARLFFAARDALASDLDEDIKAAFSALRTQMKVGCGVYTLKEAKTRIR